MISFLYLFAANSLFSQNLFRLPRYSIKGQSGKVYIFNQNDTVVNSTALGQKIGPPIVAYKGTRFTIEHIDSLNGNLTIKFLPFKALIQNNANSTQRYTPASLASRAQYNFLTDPLTISGISPRAARAAELDPSGNTRYFEITNSQASVSISSYADTVARWTVSLGALTTPFKLRPSKGLFTSNLNLGTAVSIQYQASVNWAIGGIIGLSLSSVTLDSASTGGLLSTPSERPAITPSFSALVSYKNINFTLGVGIDYINTETNIEKAWIFNKKPWIGFGIGLSLFNGTIATTGVTAIAGQ